LLAQYFSCFVRRIKIMERQKTNEAAIEQVKEKATTSNVCIIITTDKDGSRHNRPMGAVKIDDDGSCWFFASKSSGKLRDIAVNNKIQIVFANSATEDYMEVHGEGTVICDEKEITDKWSPLVNQWFPNGIKDPEVCLVRIEVTSVFYWDAATEGIQRLAIKTTTVVEDRKIAA
jgi:general stress protein 26